MGMVSSKKIINIYFCTLLQTDHLDWPDLFAFSLFLICSLEFLG